MNFNFIYIGLILLFFASCVSKEIPSYITNENLIIYFSALKNNEYYRYYEDKDYENGIFTYRYHSHGIFPEMEIKKINDPLPFDLIENRQHQLCPPDFIGGYPQHFKTLSTHTEVLNDTTFLLGALWYESSDENRTSYKTDGSIGWQASILQPSSTTYIHLWHENSEITLDSLMDWSLKMREGIIITIGER